MDRKEVVLNKFKCGEGVRILLSVGLLSWNPTAEKHEEAGESHVW